MPLGKGVLASARIGGNKRFLEDREPWEDKGKMKLLANRGFIHCPTNALRGKTWPLQNVIRTISSVWHSLLVEILMWRSFRTVFGPKAECQWEGAKEVSKKLIVNTFYKKMEDIQFFAA